MGFFISQSPDSSDNAKSADAQTLTLGVIQMSGDHSRRAFLVRVAGSLAAPLALSACRRDSDQPPAEPLLDDANLDEVPEAAVFRPPLPTSQPIIRVRVMKMRPASSVAANPISIGSNNQWLALRRTGAAGKGAALQGPLTVSIDTSGWSIIDGNGFRGGINGRDSVEISLMDENASPLLEVNEVAPSKSRSAASPARRYPGTLRLVSRHDLESTPGLSPTGAFDMVNDVPLESYLPGVLSGELYKTWHLQTFAAQSVAARSFAATEIAVFAGKRHYDVTNTASSQMYLGSVTDSKANEAVAMTRGLVLGYNGLLVSGYYSSCCGGVAASATDAIGSNPVNDVLPLHGRPEPDICTAAPVYQWKVEQPIDLLSRRLIAFGKDRSIRDLINFSRLESVEVSAKNDHGRPVRIRVADDRKTTLEMTAENFRRAANYSGQGLNPPEKPLLSSNLRASFKRNTVSFEGYGFGHGVGLCQYGAEALAKSGKDFHQILLWYYPGVELVQAYG